LSVTVADKGSRNSLMGQMLFDLQPRSLKRKL
jgi:hypothetical protein